MTAVSGPATRVIWALALAAATAAGCRSKKTEPAAAPSASARRVVVPEKEIPDAAALFPKSRLLGRWRAPGARPSLVAVDAEHSRAIVRLDPPADKPDALEMLTVDWANLVTTRIALKRLAQSDKIDNPSTPGLHAEIAGYGRAIFMGGRPHRDARMAVAPDGNTFIVRLGDALFRTGASGKDAERFGALGGTSAVFSPTGDVVAYLGCDEAVCDAQRHRLRVAPLSRPDKETKIDDAVRPSAPVFSSDGAWLYFGTRPKHDQPPCFSSVNVKTGATKKIVCATIPQDPRIVMAPGGKLAGFLADGGPSAVGDPEVTLVELPGGKAKGPKKLAALASHDVLTDDGVFIGPSLRDSWGTPGNRIALHSLMGPEERRSSLTAGEDARIEGVRLAGPNTLAVLATRQIAGETIVELSSIEFSPP